MGAAKHEDDSKQLTLLMLDIETLQRLGIIKDADTSAPTASTTAVARKHVNGQESHPRNGHASSTYAMNKHPRPPNGSAGPSTNGHRNITSRSTSPLPPPLPSQTGAPSTSNAIASTSESTLDADARPAAKRVKPEPQSSPNRNGQAVATAMLPTGSRSASIEGDHHQAPQYEESMQVNTIPSPPPLPDMESQQSSLSDFLNLPAAPAAVEERRPTPSASTSNAPPKAENPSPRLPTLAQRTGVKLDSPMPSQSQSCKTIFISSSTW